jgi:hypothetical protein
MMFFTTFIRFYTIFLVSTFLLYLIGSFLLKLLSSHKFLYSFFSKFFFSLLSGIVTVSTVTALVFTGFKSIQLLFPLLLGIYYFYQKRYYPALIPIIPPYGSRSSQYELPLVKNIAFLVILNLLVFTFCFFLVVRDAAFPYHIPNRDITYYGILSEALLRIGYENTYHVHNLIIDSFPRMVPYHYFELWINALIAWLWHIPHTLSLLLILSPIFLFTSLLSYLAFWEYFGKLNWFKVLFSFFFLFIGGFTYNHLLEIFWGGTTLFRSFDMSRQSSLYDLYVCQPWKYGPFYLFICAALLLIVMRQFIWAVFMVNCLVIATVTALPAIWGGLIMLGLALLLFKNFYPILSRKVIFHFLLIQVFFLTLYLGIYLVNLLLYKNSETILEEQISISSYLSLEELHKSLRFAIGTLVIIILNNIFLFAFGLYGFLTLRKNLPFSMRSIAIFMSTILISGFIAFLVLSPIVDANQLFLFTVHPVNNMLFILIVVFFTSQNLKSVSSIFLLALTAYVVFSNIYFFYKSSGNNFYKNPEYNYADTYLMKVKGKIESSDYHFIGYLLSEKEYTNIFTFNPTTPLIGGYIGFINDNLALISLSEFTALEKLGSAIKRQEYEAIASGSFFKFVQRQKFNQVFKSIPESQLTFIRQYHIQFLILSANVLLPDQLKPLVEEEIKDPLSGERFVILKKTIPSLSSIWADNQF